MIYVKPTGPSPSTIMIVGEGPGGDEEERGIPFCGPSGNELTRELHDAGIPRSDCFITNVSRFRPPKNKIQDFIQDFKKKSGVPPGMVFYQGKCVQPFIIDHIKHLKAEIEEVQPNVIVALGATALWALTGEDAIMNWKNSEMAATLTTRRDGKPFKVIPNLHPAYILRVYQDRKIAVEYFRHVRKESGTPELYQPPYSFTVRPSFKDTLDFLHFLLDQLNQKVMKLSVDLETRKQRLIACIGIGLSKLIAFCIPLMCVNKAMGYWSFDEEVIITQLLRKVLTHKNALIVGQNFNYDKHYLVRQLFVNPRTYLDTSVVHHTLFPGMEKALDFLASIYCEHPRYWKEESKEWDPKLGEDQFWNYNCKDCTFTYEVSDVLENLVPRMGMRAQVEEQMAVNHVALDMMLRGVRRRIDKTEIFKEEVEREIKKREEFRLQILGHELNPRSFPQMQALFYEDFRQKPVISRKTGKPTLDAEALEVIAKRQPLLGPLIRAIDEERSLGVYKSTFIDAELDPDGRIRTYFKTDGTETFRWSSGENPFGRGGNLQNIPPGGSDKIALYCKQNGPTSAEAIAKLFFGDDLGKTMEAIDKAEENGAIKLVPNGAGIVVDYRLLLPNVRELFAPDPGYVINEWDLERADLQVVVWEAEDKELKQMIRGHADIHKENAKVVSITRQQAKTFIHLTNYGGRAPTAARATGLTTHQAEIAQRRWFEAHPGIKRWHTRTLDSLSTKHQITNRFGYTRQYFDRVEDCFTEALAWVPQSTVGLVIVKVLLLLDKNLPQVQLLLQVHDSIVNQVHSSICPEIFPCIKEQFESVVVPYEDPLIIGASGKYSLESWGSAKEIN